MSEYFIVAHSKAAPFCSDESTHYYSASTPKEAMEKFVKKYNHPAGLYSAALFEDADAYHKNKKVLCRYDCNRLIATQKATKGKSGYMIREENDYFEVDGVKHVVENPEGGRIS
jgi:hypothetical protein